MTPDIHELSGAIVTYVLEKGKSSDIVTRMRQDHQIIVKPAQSTYAFSEENGLPRENYNAIRFFTHIFNSDPDIDQTVDILESMLKKI